MDILIRAIPMARRSDFKRQIMHTRPYSQPLARAHCAVAWERSSGIVQSDTG